MAYTAADVKKLREETDAPMMECKSALDEAGGDMERAKAIWREKGKVAAGKRADRATAAGVVAIATSSDKKTVAAVIVECETDFVAINPDFVAFVNELAEGFLTNDPANDPNAVTLKGQTVGSMIEQAVGRIRENIKITKALRKTTSDSFATYVHHDRSKGSIIELSGDAGETGHAVAVQAVAFPPEVVAKEQLSQEKIAAEIEQETQRAINDGKPAEMARNIATGRVNKEFIKQVVLLEQPFYKDPSKSVSQYLAETAKGSEIKTCTYLRVGQ